ncbi:MAG: hypothetical protein KAT05_05430, partial [Spirochaetes bacterium]|nr:hypothetical protein [Spirochaetota bacterium]
LTGVPVLGIIPHDDTIDTENGNVGNIVGLVKEYVDLEPVIPKDGCVGRDCGNKFKGLPVDNVECPACRLRYISRK